MKNLIPFLMLILLAAACSEDTGNLGYTTTVPTEQPTIYTDTFRLDLHTIKAEDVYARSMYSYLGQVIDQGNGNRITASFMGQFHMLDSVTMPPLDSLFVKDDMGWVADSCVFTLSTDSIYGDTLVNRTMRIYAMNEFFNDGIYYVDRDDVVSKHDPEPFHTKTFTRQDTLIGSMYLGEYKGYGNLGSYLLNKYYENPKDFKSSLRFGKNVLPGFYLEEEIDGGSEYVGRIARVNEMYMQVYFSSRKGSSDTATYSIPLVCTPEVVMQTHVTNSNDYSLLDDDAKFAYLKTPAGAFTQITLPLEKIKNGYDGQKHKSDDLTATLLQMDRDSLDGGFFTPPSTLLMLPLDSLHSFFEQKQVYNGVTSMIGTFSSSKQTYTFEDITALVDELYEKYQEATTDEERRRLEKVVLVPVKVTTDSSGNIVMVTHDLGCHSARLYKNTAYLRVYYSKHE